MLTMLHNLKVPEGSYHFIFQLHDKSEIEKVEFKSQFILKSIF